MSAFNRVTILVSHHHSGWVEMIVIYVVIRRVRFIRSFGYILNTNLQLLFETEYYLTSKNGCSHTA